MSVNSLKRKTSTFRRNGLCRNLSTARATEAHSWVGETRAIQRGARKLWGDNRDSSTVYEMLNLTATLLNNHVYAESMLA